MRRAKDLISGVCPLGISVVDLILNLILSVSIKLSLFYRSPRVVQI